MVALQDEALTLAPGERTAAGFFLALQAHHAEASGEADLARLPAESKGSKLDEVKERREARRRAGAKAAPAARRGRG